MLGDGFREENQGIFFFIKGVVCYGIGICILFNWLGFFKVFEREDFFFDMKKLENWEKIESLWRFK